MASVGSTVYGSDFNAVHLKLRQVLGDGYPYGPQVYSPSIVNNANRSYGWGQPMASSLINPSDLVTQAQFNNLITDADIAYRHIANTGISVALHTPISYDDLNTLDQDADTILSRKNSFNGAQMTQDPLASNAKATVGSAWGSSTTPAVKSYAHVYFNSDAEMQNFFNQGGYLNIQGVGPGTATAQDTSWNTLLTGINLTIDKAVYDGMSMTAQTSISSYTASGAIYGSNTVTIFGMRLWNLLVFRITLTDGHVPLGVGTLGGPGPDSVGGGAGWQIRWTRSSGVFNGPQPDIYAGQFVSTSLPTWGGFTAGTPAPIPTVTLVAAGQYSVSHAVSKNIQNYNVSKMILAHDGNATNSSIAITVNSNVYIWSAWDSIAALDFTGQVGASFKIINNGYIMGKGGAGGGSGSTAGSPGSAAINTGAKAITIDLASGFIMGGGGGGSSGSGNTNAGGGGGAGGGLAGIGLSSAPYLTQSRYIGYKTATVLPGSNGANGQPPVYMTDGPAGGGGGRIAPTSAVVLTGPTGTGMPVSGYGGPQGGTGGRWSGYLGDSTTTGGSGGTVISGANNPVVGGNGTVTTPLGTSGYSAGGGGGSWGATGGAGVGPSAGLLGGSGGKAVEQSGGAAPTWSAPGYNAKAVFGGVS
jgi:hypothetical protein